MDFNVITIIDIIDLMLRTVLVLYCTGIIAVSVVANHVTAYAASINLSLMMMAITAHYWSIINSITPTITQTVTRNSVMDSVHWTYCHITLHHVMIT